MFAAHILKKTQENQHKHYFEQSVFRKIFGLKINIYDQKLRKYSERSHPVYKSKRKKMYQLTQSNKNM